MTDTTPTTPAATRRSRRPLYIALGVIAVLLAVWFYVEQVHPRIFPKRFGVISDAGLYRSGRIHPDLMPKVLSEYGIDSIVAMTFPVEGHPFQTAEKAIAEEMEIPIYRFPLAGDGTGDYMSYVGALERIRTELGAGRKVLVHCAAGTERTGGVSFFYKTLFEGVSVEDAHAHMIDFHHDPERNPKLFPFLAEITPAVKAALVRDGVLPAVDPIPLAE